MEGFNRRFNKLVKSLPQDIKPPENSILIFYVQAFEGEMRYQLRDKEPTNVREAQDKAIKIEKNMQASGKSNVLGFSKGSPPESDKVKKVENQEPQGDSIKELARLIKQMEEVYINQLSSMHNKIVAMEKDKGNNHKPNDRWQKGLPKGPPYQQWDLSDLSDQQCLLFGPACYPFAHTPPQSLTYLYLQTESCNRRAL